MEYDAQLKDWKSIHCEAFGKTGCRRIVPGQYLAADPKGRALMIGNFKKHIYISLTIFFFKKLELRSRSLFTL